MHLPLEPSTRTLAHAPSRAPEGSGDRSVRAVVGDSGRRPDDADARRAIRQFSLRGMLAVWAAATLPMVIGSWIVAPRLAGSFGDLGLAKALVVTLTAGLFWQLVLTTVLVAREQHSLRWAVVKDALWLHAPRNPKTGRRGGRLWWVILPLTVGLAAEELIPTLPHAATRDLSALLNSHAGHAWFKGSWGWFALTVLMFFLNTVAGEELLFRGFLLPRMIGRFGRHAWLANGVAFAGYHLHRPWAIPGALFDSLWLAYPTQRYRSAWIGISVHSAQSVLFTFAVLGVVLR
jgi:membrane protease YdiL (CAAX protease family)